MIAKTSCQHCEQHIEFDAEGANQFVTCPTCGKQTRLLMAVGIGKPKPARTTKTISAKRWWVIISLSVVTCLCIVGLLVRSFRSYLFEAIGAGAPVVIGLGVVVLLGILVYHLIISGILLRVIIGLMIAIGLVLAVCGGFDM
jgi:hypothetical protein